MTGGAPAAIQEAELMKIIHILLGKANPKATMNGVNVVVNRYASMMYERGHDVEVWGITYKPYSNMPKPNYAIKLFQRHHLWPRSLDEGLIGRLRELDQAKTVIHFHGGFILEYPKIGRFLKDCRYFIMPHGAYAENCFCRRRLLKRIYWKVAERDFISRSRGLVLLHKGEVFQGINKDVKDVCHRIIPNGADLELFRLRTRNCASLKDSSIVWGYCGRIDSEYKGVDLMISSFIDFSCQRGDERHTLAIVGDGPDLKSLRDKYSKEIESGLIVVHGALFGEAKVNILKKMSYFILLSRGEGLPLSCLDALGLGIPLIVTPGTNLAEDVTRYKAGIATLSEKETVVANMHRLADMNRENLVKGCLALVTEKYNWEISCDKMIELYEEVL